MNKNKEYNKGIGKGALINNKESNKKIKHWKIISLYLLIYDILAILMSFFLALWIRFDCEFARIPSGYITMYLKFIPIYIIFSIVVFYLFKLYNSVWQFASFSELNRVSLSSIITFIFNILFGIIFFTYLSESSFNRMPVSYYIFGSMLQFFFVIGVRFSYRFILLEKSRWIKNDDNIVIKSMLIGAGTAGQMILRDLNSHNNLNEKIVCIIDDNSNKWNRLIDGIPIVGGRNSIIESAKHYNIKKIYYAIPSSSVETKRNILNICKETGCELKNLPGMYQLMKGEVSINAMKEVSIEDLLEREAILIDNKGISDFISNKTVLVTGGGGSIGSELCRQVATNNPKTLVIFDIYENNAYEIEQELKRKYAYINIKVVIGSVRDGNRLLSIFKKYRPNIVYHAAAHKHVPLMEDSPLEAIKNNVLGTYKTAFAAMLYGCEKFVLISTDKAVNPTNIMGASKRMCEMIIQTFDNYIKNYKLNELPNPFNCEISELLNRNIKTNFVAVRFGNVLGSNGSVIPVFKKQIKEGGPVTVTHPEIIRYFMTIPEAVSLVLQAGIYAKNGEIFVLDMGEPVKIDTLARNLIKLSGYKPDVDINVVYTGLRPGEKLFEEKLMAEEGLRKTPNKLIHIASPIKINTTEFINNVKELMDLDGGILIDDTNFDTLYNKQFKVLMKEMVNTYNA
ncbi:nucleoside-diphosphate sugar epimerase/dehydratase [Peptostreptococcus equinus]|uniref:Nucleoside-diphosphate sugar epimerase/dehydratase n=1 Tax=Peptostreptococcus equinus TaxID=3003601 RepID=A0ABY7JQD1_9FIRM|nr:nucleoside-diphosphate sugar epimerase/dehydratase [Peptostreptococcus sp. CBA3647]WAW14162.1 nucleoside-diphosphate sugar epimerase/dehydratase [Peptostreptococcus sp. CBA3647]